jgi:hypothetical protein
MRNVFCIFFILIFFSSFSAKNNTLSVIFEDPCRRKRNIKLDLDNYSAYKDKYKNCKHNIKAMIYFINQDKKIDPLCHFIVCTKHMILPTDSPKKIFVYFIEMKKLIPLTRRYFIPMRTRK